MGCPCLCPLLAQQSSSFPQPHILADHCQACPSQVLSGQTSPWIPEWPSPTHALTHSLREILCKQKSLQTPWDWIPEGSATPPPPAIGPAEPLMATASQ